MEKILILDFGSQFTQLIARRIRELGVFCEIEPASSRFANKAGLKGIILSGGPHSVFDPGSPQASTGILEFGVPILGICYGMQWLAQSMGGRVEPAASREYGFMPIRLVSSSKIFTKISGRELKTWMSHGDEVRELPPGFTAIATSHSGGVAAMENSERKIYALQFHPEVTHT